MEDFLLERIEKTKELIERYEDAVSNIMANGIQSYVLDTGQSKQVVTKANIEKLQEQIDVLYNRLATLDARVNGTGVVIGGPLN